MISTITDAPAIPQTELADFAQSWLRSLRAENKSRPTLRAYGAAVRSLDAYLVAHGMPTALAGIHLEHVEAWISSVLEGNSKATAALYIAGARLLFKWLQDEGEIRENPMQRMRQPRASEPRVEVLHEDELQRLLAACAGDSLTDRRDAALVRVALDTGMRRSELASLTVDDIDLDRGLIRIRHGKGDRQRVVGIGRKTVVAIDRYLRKRRGHRAASTSALWLGAKTGGLASHTVAAIVKTRAERAGIHDFHLHRMRHTMAHRWLRDGGSEDGLAALGGWRDRAIMQHYGSSQRQERALEEHRARALGDRL